MYLKEIWRYPVKTMAGEKLQRVELGPLGIAGDRVIHVEDARGRVVTSRSHPRFLGHTGSLDAQGEVLVDGRPWQSAEVAAEVLDQLIVSLPVWTIAETRVTPLVDFSERRANMQMFVQRFASPPDR